MSQPDRALFFDFGGTLFSYTGVHGKAFYPILAEATRRLGVNSEPREARRAYWKASGEAFREFNPKPYYLHKDLFHGTFRRFSERLGVPPEQDFVDWLYDQQREMFYTGCALRDDCLETLTQLRDQGCYLSIVSNIDDDYLLPMMKRTGLDSVLHHWTSSEEAQSCKPDGGIFKLAMSKAQIAPERVIFVGDSAHHDVLGANRIGMRTVLIQEPGVSAPGTETEKHGEPDHIIEQLAELIPIVRDHLPPG